MMEKKEELELAALLIDVYLRIPRTEELIRGRLKARIMELLDVDVS